MSLLDYKEEENLRNDKRIERDEEYIKNKSEAKIDKQIFILKIKQFFLKFHHFPALVKDFFKKTLFGLLKLWGIILFGILIWFLYFTDSFSTLYYKINMNLERSNIERIERVIEQKKVELKEAKKNMSCYKNQFSRIANDQFVDINYCK